MGRPAGALLVDDRGDTDFRKLSQVPSGRSP
jgi:hypothetical protein